MRLLTDREVMTLFGDPSMFVHQDGSVDRAWEAAILADVVLPAPLLYGDTALEVKRLRVHRRLRLIFAAAFAELNDAGLFPSIGNIEGAYCWRTQRRAAAARSRHCWAIAVDLDALHNPFLGLVPHVDGRVRTIMRAHGFAWGAARIHGGDFPWERRDPMHWEWAGDAAALAA